MNLSRAFLFVLLALQVLLVPLGTRLTVCLAGVHGQGQGEVEVGDHSCAPTFGWCDAHCHGDHAHAHGAAPGRSDARGSEQKSDEHQRGDGPRVDLPLCEGCQVLAFNDDCFDGCSARCDVPDQVLALDARAPVVVALVYEHRCAPRPPRDAPSAAGLPGVLPLRV